jgi:hypothetical protein
VQPGSPSKTMSEPGTLTARVRRHIAGSFQPGTHPDQVAVIGDPQDTILGDS